jgi:hypothetical protein
MSTTRRLAVILAADVAPSRRRGDRIGRSTSVIGTERTCRCSRLMSVVGGRADHICSKGVFRLLTQLRH